jgi:hypothetical protein
MRFASLRVASDLRIRLETVSFALTVTNINVGAIVVDCATNPHSVACLWIPDRMVLGASNWSPDCAYFSK